MFDEIEAKLITITLEKTASESPDRVREPSVKYVRDLLNHLGASDVPSVPRSKYR